MGVDLLPFSVINLMNVANFADREVGGDYDPPKSSMTTLSSIDHEIHPKCRLNSPYNSNPHYDNHLIFRSIIDFVYNISSKTPLIFPRVVSEYFISRYIFKC